MPDPAAHDDLLADDDEVVRALIQLLGAEVARRLAEKAVDKSTLSTSGSIEQMVEPAEAG